MALKLRIIDLICKKVEKVESSGTKCIIPALKIKQIHLDGLHFEYEDSEVIKASDMSFAGLKEITAEITKTYPDLLPRYK